MAIECQGQWHGDWLWRKELGKGGQGTVCLVRRIPKRVFGAFEERFENAHAITKFSVGGHPVDSMLGILLDAIEQIEESPLGALKLLHPPNNVKNSASYVQRFERELDALQRIRHPGLVRLLDENRAEKWFVMEYHSGGRLTDNLARFRGQPAQAIRALRPIVAALAEIHQHGLIHRDIKPDNIFVARDGALVLGDLGLLFDESADSRLTATLENAGTRDWMPTWAQGARLDSIPKSFDTFGLGKVFWSMLSGRSFLRAHHFDRPEFDLAKLFPGESWTIRVNQFLSMCVSDHEEVELHNAATFANALSDLENFLTIDLRDRQPSTQLDDDPKNVDTNERAIIEIVGASLSGIVDLVHVQQQGIQAGLTALGVSMAIRSLLAKSLVSTKEWRDFDDNQGISVTLTDGGFAWLERQRSRLRLRKQEPIIPF